MTKWLVFIIAIGSSTTFYGKDHLEGKINEFFDRFNVVSNVTASSYDNSLLGVNFLGNSGSVRTAVLDVNPIHIQLPSFSAGCGGIDYTLGGINIASAEEMRQALKSIASNGISYSFLLGVEVASPLISSVMKQVQTWANQINSININSCELATTLVQGMWPKGQRASSYICEHAGSSSPIFRDLIEAKHGCRERGNRDAAFEKARDNNQHILVGNYNVAWKALADFHLDKETKNLFMCITGTIVVKDSSKGHEEKKSIHVYPPMYKQAIDTLRYGGSIKNAYKIDQNEIDVKDTEPLIIRAENSWKNKIFSLLKQIQTKILSESKDRNQALTDEEKNLISTTHFPMGGLISLMSQYNGKGALIALDRYSDLIAFERVLKFAEEVVRDTLNKAETLRAAQVSGYELDEYIKQIHDVLKDLQALTMENYQKISAEHQVIEYMIHIDRNLREKERGV